MRARGTKRRAIAMNRLRNKVYQLRHNNELK